MTSRKTLSTIDADTLLSTTLPPTRFIIDRLLPQGLHILAGAPKVGKSWLALWLCLQVAQGTSVWDFPTHRGTVLYLCLEDSLTRTLSGNGRAADGSADAGVVSAENQDRKRTGRQRLAPLPAHTKGQATLCTYEKHPEGCSFFYA